MAWRSYVNKPGFIPVLITKLKNAIKKAEKSADILSQIKSRD